MHTWSACSYSEACLRATDAQRTYTILAPFRPNQRHDTALLQSSRKCKTRWPTYDAAELAEIRILSELPSVLSNH